MDINGSEMRLRAFYDFNPPSKRHWTYILFVLKRDPEDNQPKREGTIGFYLINPIDNLENINKEFMEFLDGLPEKKRNRFKYGRFADDSDGALWTDELLGHNRLVGADTAKLPDMLRIVIAVDPSGTKGPEDERSDEVGITVCGLGTDGHGYLLEDLSGAHKPEDWATIVDSAFTRHKADLVVGEKNFGGDMVRAVLQAKNPDLPYKEVTATRGKIVRAEPVSALYEQHKIHHVGYFSELEDQLCGMTTSGYMGLRSPDRADSMIWGFTELFPGIVKHQAERAHHTPKVVTASRSASRYDRKIR
jgi:phage terminase large subunit-like protein